MVLLPHLLTVFGTVASTSTFLYIRVKRWCINLLFRCGTIFNSLSVFGIVASMGTFPYTRVKSCCTYICLLWWSMTFISSSSDWWGTNLKLDRYVWSVYSSSRKSPVSAEKTTIDKHKENVEYTFKTNSQILFSKCYVKNKVNENFW